MNSIHPFFVMPPVEFFCFRSALAGPASNFVGLARPYGPLPCLLPYSTIFDVARTIVLATVCLSI